jgi:hypothetical protein
MCYDEGGHHFQQFFLQVNKINFEMGHFQFENDNSVLAGHFVLFQNYCQYILRFLCGTYFIVFNFQFSVEETSPVMAKFCKSKKSIFMPVVLYGCETWSLTLREEHRLRVFENRVLKRIFGLKRDEVTEGWRKLHNEELHNLYSKYN